MWHNFPGRVIKCGKRVKDVYIIGASFYYSLINNFVQHNKRGPRPEVDLAKFGYLQHTLCPILALKLYPMKIFAKH